MCHLAASVSYRIVSDGHVCKFDDKVWRQKNGGAIRLKMSGELAGVFMMW